jgi:thiamine pyrophosphokinase
MGAASGEEGLLLLGGEGPEREHLLTILNRAPFVIAADSGLRLASRLGLTPDLLVGDLDSLADGRELDSFPRERVRQFPSDKDETDAELGLRLFRELGYGRVVLAGGGGGRLDHLLAIVDLFEREPPPAAWFTAREEVRRVEGELALTGCKGLRVSFFPLGHGASGLKSAGLKWPLDGLEWSRGQEGVSNLVTEDRALIWVGRGRLLMIQELRR